ncbi:MAG: glycosyltransferase family 2 protein [Desulfobulbus sp.]|jgi:glycosyltransferase involved in cell wall biosynthesis|nr:glycosyltransferase family 2 protein [Desulfobulbus sp.]
MNTSPVDVIVPVYNEEEALPDFHQRLSNVPLALRPIYIDNASTDGSLRLLHSFPGAVVIEHKVNEGYGASLRDGIRFATAERIVIIDADCEYPPEAILEMVHRLDHCDVVYASRFLQPQQAHMGWLKVFGNQVITRLFNLLFHQQLTDLYTGSKAFRREVVADLPMEQDGFEHVLEVAARLARAGRRFEEIHVTFAPRSTGVSKMGHLQETAKYMYYLCHYALTLGRGGR